MNDLERFDLDSDIRDLDMDSAQALLALTDLWGQRRRLRARWTLRQALTLPTPTSRTKTAPEARSVPAIGVGL